MFIPLHDFLKRTKLLEATVDFDITEGVEDSTAGLPNSLGNLVDRFVPCSVKRKLGQKAIRNYSKDIGHSLDFELQW